jgi:Glu-tRNA(Gln) amidotransferase subunit E-like FAD-binding protein
VKSVKEQRLNLLTKEKIDYKKLKLKAGLEIHQQLDTANKLFCNCSTAMKEREPIAVMKRKQHPVASELGEVDVAAQYEFLRSRAFTYQIFRNETCLVELDEEPPRPLNLEALQIALQVALLLNCEIPNEIHVMRKTVIDGSNTSGFQRTAVVGLNGSMKYKGRRIAITHVSLEEDAAAIVKEEGENVTYRLSRLGVPLVEIGTGLLEDYTPQEIQDIAFNIGMICRSTEKVKRGIGTIRQDINISIRGGKRVEIKGVQDLGLLAKVVELEVKRQLSLPKVEEETRAVNEDGTTKYTRPLPGSARMYPETDIQPIVLQKEFVEKLRKELPEPWMKKLARFQSKYRLSEDLAKQIIRSEHLELFEKIVNKTNAHASIVANAFISTIKDLEKREKVEIRRLREEHYIDLFENIAKGKIVKEAIPEIIKFLAEKPGETATSAIKELNLEPIGIVELRKIVEEVIAKPGLIYDKAVGLVMSKVRGRIEAEVVMQQVKKMMKR